MAESTPTLPNQPPIGIDLGTTYSAVAYLDASGRPITILNGEGDLLTPSAISFDQDTVVVGKEAIKASVFEPSVFADCFKRDMGRLQFRRLLGTQEVPPEVLSGFLLERLKRDAETKVGPIRQVVITVPAFFDETRRHATQEAGRLAGLEVLDIINEPTAAAIAYCYYRKQSDSSSGAPIAKRENLLVYDLGGGTFDVTVLEADGSQLRTLATDGDVQLGGRDFDERLVTFVAQQFMAEHGVDPCSDPHDAFQLWIDAQEAKHSLSTRTKVSIPCIHAGIRMRFDISRTEYEALTADLLNRTESTTQLVLRQANLNWSDIDRVLLVGGASRMPMVIEMLRRLSGKEPDRTLSPDEAVAHGAAIYAGIVRDKMTPQSVPALDIVNVNAHSLGIIGLDRRTNRRQNVVIIPKNTPLPCQVVRKFATARDNQANVKIAIVEGESKRPEHCIALGECVVRNLPRGLPKNTKVEVEYRYAANGRISVLARVPSVRQSATVEIHHERARDLADLDGWRAKLGVRVPNASSLSVDKGGSAGVNSSKVTSFNKLDELLIRVGERAATGPLPDALKSHKAAVVNAVTEWKTTASTEKSLTLAREKAISQSEIVRATAELAQTRASLRQAELKVRFAQIALGRECVQAGNWPRELNAVVSEIQRIQDGDGAML